MHAFRLPKQNPLLSDLTLVDNVNDLGTFENGPTYRCPVSLSTAAAASGADVQPIGDIQPNPVIAPLVSESLPIETLDVNCAPLLDAANAPVIFVSPVITSEAPVKIVAIDDKTFPPIVAPLTKGLASNVNTPYTAPIAPVSGAVIPPSGADAAAPPTPPIVNAATSPMAIDSSIANAAVSRYVDPISNA
jgi:hypothetical protein